jgi:hypothetical protein
MNPGGRPEEQGTATVQEEARDATEPPQAEVSNISQSNAVLFKEK